jgi:polyhydroxybutyrate depolymerase
MQRWRHAGLIGLGLTFHAWGAAEDWRLVVRGVERQARVHAPESALREPAPLVFVYHGHGGGIRQAERSFGLHLRWPEAVVVYPQGLPTPGKLTDPEGRRSGWQHRPGEMEDRDLAFFDALWERLHQAYRVDARRVHVTGHSNGGAFTYTLWAARGDRFASVAPSGCVAPTQGAGLKPKPVLHVAGRKDALVRFAWQERSLEGLRQLNGCSGEGEPWAEWATRHASPQGTPVIAFVHPGGHALPAAVPPLLVRFFREHPAPHAEAKGGP